MLHLISIVLKWFQFHFDSVLPIIIWRGMCYCLVKFIRNFAVTQVGYFPWVLPIMPNGPVREQWGT